MRALVIGGGVAGPVAAMAFQKAGMEAVVVEAHAADQGDVGSYFTVTPNGLDALAVVDALAIATREGFPTRRNVMRNSAGVRPRRPPARHTALGWHAGPDHETVAGSLPAWWTRPSAAGSGSTMGVGWSASSEQGRRRRDIRGWLDRASRPGRRRRRRPFDRASTDRSGGSDGRYVGLTNFGGITAADRVTGLLSSRRRGNSLSGVMPSSAPIGRRPVTSSGSSTRHATRSAVRNARRRPMRPGSWLAGLFSEDAGPAAALIRAGRLELAGDNTYDLGHVPTWHRTG